MSEASLKSTRWKAAIVAAGLEYIRNIFVFLGVRTVEESNLKHT